MECKGDISSQITSKRLTPLPTRLPPRMNAVTGMRTLHWCMLGTASVLLVAEVVISQLCDCTILLLDAFHTLFVLMHVFLHPHADTAFSGGSHLPSSSSSSSSSSSETPSPLSPDPSSATEGSPDPAPHPPSEEALPVTSAPPPPPPPPSCASFSDDRFQAVGDLLSNLTLVALCICHAFKLMESQPMERPLLVVIVAAFSLLYKTVALCVNWAGLQEEWTGATDPPGADSQCEVKHPVFAAEESDMQVLPGPVQVQAATDDPLQTGALVLCNPGACNVPVLDCQTLEPQPGGSTQPADSSNATSPVCESPHSTGGPSPSSRGPLCLLWPLLVAQALLSALLALVLGLVMLLLQQRCLLLRSGACRVLPYLDQVLTAVTLVVLIISTVPQVRRCGLLLMQASPPHLRVSDLERRIAGVHGVQAVHDIHVWQVTGSFLVASVHVRCHAWLPVHRCADLILAVTELLQRAGVSCCTVQPEFAPGPAGGALHPTCSLSCGKACSRHMCCSPLEEEEEEAEETKGTLAPPTGRRKEELFVIENSFVQLETLK